MNVRGTGELRPSLAQNGSDYTRARLADALQYRPDDALENRFRRRQLLQPQTIHDRQ